MELEEVIQKEESFKRTEKRLDDEWHAYSLKMEKYLGEYQEFKRAIEKEGYVYGISGWGRSKT